MAKNRKNQSAAIRFGPAVKALLFCVVAGGAAVGYVWQKEQISKLGRRIREREMHLSEMKDKNKKQRDQLAMLRSPGRLDKRVAELNLGLGQPKLEYIWRLPEPGETPGSMAQPGGQYAAREARVPALPSRL